MGRLPTLGTGMFAIALSGKKMSIRLLKFVCVWSVDLEAHTQQSWPLRFDCLQYAVIVTNQGFAGHLGANELAAAAIAVTVSPHMARFNLPPRSKICE